MKRRVLDFIVCPRCRGTFILDVFRETKALSGDPSAGTEIIEGALRCGACDASYPVVEGVPRLLRGSLLARMRRRYPDFFARHPEFVDETSPADDDITDTLESFTRQRLDLKPPGPAAARQWEVNLRRNLGSALQVEELRDKLVLDVGCGFGRHLYLASAAGAETVGIDLSGGVDLAYRNNLRHPRCHVVQGNICERPLRDDIFDVVWSFGVLHHLPEPGAGFRDIVGFAKPERGLVAIWVYGYRGMAFTYRLSHMRSLHAVTRKLSHAQRLRASRAVAGLLSALYWEPLRLAQTLGLRSVVNRLPLTVYIDHPWLARVAAVHDRLSTPITHFHDHDELREWFTSAALTDVHVEDTERRGWRAYGRRDPVPCAERAQDRRFVASARPEVVETASGSMG